MRIISVTVTMAGNKSVITESLRGALFVFGPLKPKAVESICLGHTLILLVTLGTDWTCRLRGETSSRWPCTSTDRCDINPLTRQTFAFRLQPIQTFPQWPFLLHFLHSTLPENFLQALVYHGTDGVTYIHLGDSCIIVHVSYLQYSA